jgi:hypothetical protein
MKIKGIKAVVLTVVLFPLIAVSSVMFWMRAKDQIKPPNRDMWE